MSVRSDVAAFDGAVRSAARLSYDYILRIVLLSALWVVASLPVVTLGVASVGLYAAVHSLRQTGTIDWDLVRTRVREQYRDATLLAPLPLVFFGIAWLYSTRAAPGPASVTTVLGILAFYVGLYAALVFVPTFVGLADGVPVWTALAEGQRWVGDHPALALATGSLTAVVLAVSLLLTVTFPLLFAGLAASLHVAVVEQTDDAEPDPAPEVREQYRGLGGD
jgi:hypothetical protein